MQRNEEAGSFSHWGETQDASGKIRPVYGPLFQRLDALPRPQIRSLDERLEATMREMGVTFDIARERPWGRRPWFCDLLPQIFTPQEWEPLERGISQRLRAFEMFLRDIHGKKEILRDGAVGLPPVNIDRVEVLPPVYDFLELVNVHGAIPVDVKKLKNDINVVACHVDVSEL